MGKTMTDTDIEYAKHRMEVLRMARTLLNEEYINKRAEDHNKWLAEADQAWRNKGIKLPYPPFAPYPTEAQILERAETLMKFIGKGRVEDTNDAIDVNFTESATATATDDKNQIKAPASGPLFSNLDEVTKKINKVKQVLTAQDIIDENKEK
jgi:hypothetical protein